ncbi:uncharacterized protein [Narcine bancroftii]|uniref:uncharacterized protein n=1 Tax=Narcine bancroftii TaxID=1343680 RepID=UPI0038312864
MSAAGGVKRGAFSSEVHPSSWMKRKFSTIQHDRKLKLGEGQRETTCEDSTSDSLCDTGRCGAPPIGGGSRTVRRIGTACLLSLAALMGSISLDLNSSLEAWRETESSLQALFSCRSTFLIQFINRLQKERGSVRWNQVNSSVTTANITRTLQVSKWINDTCTELELKVQGNQLACSGGHFNCHHIVDEFVQNLGANWTNAEGETDNPISSIIYTLLNMLGEPEGDMSRARSNQNWADVMSFKLSLQAEEAILLLQRSQFLGSSRQGDPAIKWHQAATSMNHALFVSENMQECCTKNSNLSLYFAHYKGICLFNRSSLVFQTTNRDAIFDVVHQINNVQECLLHVADYSMRRKSRDILSALSFRVTLLVTACLIYPIVFVSFKQMTEWIQNYARSLMERTEDLNRQRRVAEDLLHQMLPKSVAKQLRKRKHVEAESYEQVTIYFSDIVGFTTIAASCTPLQVVQMLNNLYMCFDTRIESYDVYKVETIGDAYMVVSGLPERKGTKHADEIAKMALDLVAAVRQVPIPHMPTERLQLRAGIHTGPCVAGVVGYKMPRYCLFGDTVNTASRMESTSLPQKIHISSVTFTALIKDDDYEIELRGDTELKGKGKMKTYWLIGNKNYSVQNDSLVCHRNPRIKKRNENGESMSSVQQSGTSSTTQIPSNRTTPLSIMEASASGHPGPKIDCPQKADDQLVLLSLKSGERSQTCSPNSENGLALHERHTDQEQEFAFKGIQWMGPEPSTTRRDGTQSDHENRHTEKSELLPGFVNLN